MSLDWWTQEKRFSFRNSRINIKKSIKKLDYHQILNERLSPAEAKTSKKFPIYIVLDNIRSVYNVGSFFRSCDSSAIQELILCGYTPYPPRNDLQKTALGSIESVNWRRFESTIEAINYLKDKGVKVISIEQTDKKRSYLSIEKSEFPLAFIFGNELTGIDDQIIEKSDDSIEIPMYGHKHSLNVSVSAGIIIYEALRKLNEDS